MLSQLMEVSSSYSANIVLFWDRDFNPASDVFYISKLHSYLHNVFTSK